jgi:hypothetical protein
MTSCASANKSQTKLTVYHLLSTQVKSESISIGSGYCTTVTQAVGQICVNSNLRLWYGCLALCGADHTLLCFSFDVALPLVNRMRIASMMGYGVLLSGTARTVIIWF